MMSGYGVDNTTNGMVIVTTDDNVTDEMAGGGGWVFPYWLFPAGPSEREQELLDLFADIRDYAHCILGWLGVFLNGLIILVLLLKDKSKEQTVNLLLTALALSDIFSLFISLNHSISVATDGKKALSLTKVGCEIVQYVTNVARDYSSYLILTFTVDRFLSIKFPLKKSLWITRKRVLAFILFLVPIFAAMEWYVPYYLKLWHFEWDDSYRCMTAENDELTRMTAIFRYTIGFTAPAIVVALLNVLIVRQLRRWSQQRAHMMEGSVEDKKEQRSASSSHNRTLTILLVVVSTFSFLVTLPKVVLHYCAAVWKHSSDWTGSYEFRMMVDFTDSLALLNHCSNFFFYCLSGSQFRNDLFMTPARLRRIIFCRRGAIVQRKHASSVMTKSTAAGPSSVSAVSEARRDDDDVTAVTVSSKMAP